MPFIVSDRFAPSSTRNDRIMMTRIHDRVFKVNQQDGGDRILTTQ
ncbi:MAG: hypothetical protein ACKO2V_26585 [Snowella sp.]